ncbi:MAG: hypothetical protein IJH61_09280 [Eubacteriaceae bacterium]|nr:hypothetical protein [Eubacteriaceae bacterium]
MQKNNNLKKRKSSFNPDRDTYLTSDGKYYCYKYWDPESGDMVTQKLEVGKDISVELAIMLDQFDHDIGLNNRYQNELRDPLFDAKVKSYKAEHNSVDAVYPWDTLAEKNGSPEDAVFVEPKPENPKVLEVRRVIVEECTESQKHLFYEHFGQGKQLEEIRQAEYKQTGKLPSSAAMTNRKNKLLDKVAKALGVERVKRHKYPQKK